MTRQQRRQVLVDRNGTWSAQASNEYMTTILSGEYTEANNNFYGRAGHLQQRRHGRGRHHSAQDRGYNASARTRSSLCFEQVDATDAAKELIVAAAWSAASSRTPARHGGGPLRCFAKNATSGAALMDGTDSYNVDDASAKIRIPYAVYTG